ncbi:MAG: nuclear transport factor 2 family protein [Saprospiraceae bacterium]|nr:nuclear transport factor 2 family protein [Saprospiraceae bacterium]
MKLLILFVVLTSSISVSAQSKQDSATIKTATQDYVEGFFTSDSSRLAKAMSADLIKRIIDNRSGSSKLMTIGLKELIGYTKMGQKMPDNNPSEPFKAKVDIYDITGGIALAKVSTNKMPDFFDYIQAGKINGEWKIINVLWAFN